MEFSLPESPLPQEAPKATWPLRLTGFGLVLFAAAMLASLSTYHAGEMGWAALNPVNATEASRVPCTNALGTLGLYLAGMLLRLLGAGAFYAMALLFLPALTLLFRPGKKMLAQSLAALAMLICACSALSVQPWLLHQWAAARYIPDAGGMLGHLDGSMVLAPLLGGQAALALLVAGHGFALIYYARMGFIEFCTAVGQDFRHLLAEYRMRAAARRERRAAEHEAWLQKQKELQAQREAEQAQQRALAEQEAAQRAARLAADSAAAERLRQQAEPQEDAPAADAHGAALPPRRTGIFARLRRTETAAAPQQPAPAEEPEDYEAPIPFEQQMEQARLRDAARVQMQQPPSARRPRSASQLDSRRRENLLDMNKQVDEKLALSNAPGQDAPLRPFARVPREETQLPFSRTAQPAATPLPAPRPARPLPQPRVNTPAPKQASLGLDTRQQSEDYPLPPYDMLKYEPVSEAMSEATKREMEETQQILIDALATFGIEVTGGDITRGPSITRYEFYPPRGLRVKKIADLSKELMLATSAKAINILAPIPGKNTVGIELENATKAPVYLRELLQSANFADKKLRIPVALGKDVYGNAVIGDLAAMPHTLVAGTTGSGKSVCINSMILSMLYKFRPDELKLILVDPKVVEMQPYRKLPHLACPVVTVPARVIGALRWAVNEMEHRYQLFSKCGVRNFEDFNARDPQNDPDPLGYDPAEDRDNPNFNPEGIARELEAQAEEEIMLGEEEEDESANDDPRIPEKLPYIVIIIDELADLMLTVKEDMEAYIARLTQKARAAGIHLVAATQTPRAQVVTGTIKANIPSRIAFKVASPLDSRVILDTNGAENLLGKGDSLFLPPGGITKMVRIQGAFVSDSEIAQIVAFCASHAKQNFERAMEAEMDGQENGGSAGGDNGGRLGHKGMSTEEDELYTRCVELVVTQRKASTSMLQRAFSIGYGRAAKIMDAMEKNGVIAPAGGNTARPREVLID